MKLAVDMPVSWLNGTGRRAIVLSGHIESLNGKMAYVRSNGTVYEVVKTDLRHCKYKLHSLCKRCGKFCENFGTEHCSRECFNASERDRLDAEVFAALVDYKTQNDGMTPTINRLANLVGIHRATVNDVLHRLENAGRIWRIGGEGHKQIGVVGGKWTYRED